MFSKRKHHTKVLVVDVCLCKDWNVSCLSYIRLIIYPIILQILTVLCFMLMLTTYVHHSAETMTPKYIHFCILMWMHSFNVYQGYINISFYSFVIYWLIFKEKTHLIGYIKKYVISKTKNNIVLGDVANLIL